MRYRAAMSDLTASLSLRPAKSIDEVLAIMTQIDALLPRADGIACFNKLYLAVTTGVRSAYETGKFDDPAFLVALDVAFANLYFDAFAAFDEGRGAVGYRDGVAVSERRSRR